MQRSRHLLLLAAFTGILTVMTLALLEGGLRIYQAVRHDSRYIVNDDILHHKLRSNVDIIDRTRDNPFHLITNSQGWPEANDVPLAKPTKTFRLFEVGDSNTQGVIDHGQRMSDLVERDLNRQAGPDAPFYDVINTGTSSYSMLTYRLQIEYDILPREPNLVVINVDMTDVANDLLYRKFAVRDASNRIVALIDASETSRFNYLATPTGLIAVEKASPLYVWFVEHSATGYYLDKVISRLRYSGSLGALGYPVDESANWLSMEWTRDIEANVGWSMAVLAETIRMLKAADVAVLLTGVPHLPQFEGKWSPLPFDVLAAVACAEGVPFLNDELR